MTGRLLAGCRARSWTPRRGQRRAGQGQRLDAEVRGVKSVDPAAWAGYASRILGSLVADSRMLRDLLARDEVPEQILNLPLLVDRCIAHKITAAR